MAFARSVVEHGDRFDTVATHHVTNILVGLDGDLATAESYFLAFSPHRDRSRPDDDRRGNLLGVMSGRYLDELRRTGDGWRITRRRVVSDWTRDHLAGEPWRVTSADHGGYLRGSHREQDPSHDLVTSCDR